MRPICVVCGEHRPTVDGRCTDDLTVAARGDFETVDGDEALALLADTAEAVA